MIFVLILLGFQLLVVVPMLWLEPVEASERPPGRTAGADHPIEHCGRFPSGFT